MPQVVRGSLADDDARRQFLESLENRRTSRQFSDPDAPPRLSTTTSPRRHTDDAVDNEHEHAAASPSPSRSPPPVRHSTASSPSPSRHVAFNIENALHETPSSQDQPDNKTRPRRSSGSSLFRHSRDDRPSASAYYDSRAGSRKEWRRRGSTLQEYYASRPELLPQLPFTFHRGTKRWRLLALIIVSWIDACVLPIILFYAMYYGGDVPEWIIFAVITTIWGGPAYFEFAVRSLRLSKEERFYRPLGTDRRWCFDYLTWFATAAINVIVILFVIGSAPHDVWDRVLCMPMPALLYCMAVFVGGPTLYWAMGWKAPFRLSSTKKGEDCKPGVYYFVEDVVAVNGHAGRPYREALMARYEASPRFRKIILGQSLLWSVSSLLMAVPLTVVAVIPVVPEVVSYGVCWGAPFVWGIVWAIISVVWCKRELVKEKYEWEHTVGPIDDPGLVGAIRSDSSVNAGGVGRGRGDATADADTDTTELKEVTASPSPDPSTEIKPPPEQMV